jgi:hypothetical protein
MSESHPTVVRLVIAPAPSWSGLARRCRLVADADGNVVKGYGRIGSKPAHRATWEARHGPLPSGYQICHGCDRKSCIEVSHMSACDMTENIVQAMQRGLCPRGERHWNARLREHEVIEIRRRHAAGASQMSLAREYGVAPQTVNSIVKRWTWRHVEDVA